MISPAGASGAPGPAVPTEDLADEAPVRRAPFAASPAVGERGARTRQEILRAAVAAFAEVGYHGCRVEHITETAGCSRPSFYQYFSSKDDVFRQLAGQVARQLVVSAEALPLLTGDASGRDALRDWAERYAATFDEYESVFAAFSSAVGRDAIVASGSARVGERHVEALLERVDPGLFEASDGRDAVSVLSATAAQANLFRRLLAGPADSSPLERSRVNDSIADIVHRTLFGAIPDVNCADRGYAPIEHRIAPGLDAPRLAVRRGGTAVARRTREALLGAGAGVFASLGYHAARVDDVVEAAGTSHGTFYRYFRNKGELFRAVAGRAGNRVVAAVDELPDLAASPLPTWSGLLRRWLDQYVATVADERAIMRLWLEAMARDEEFHRTSIAALWQSQARAAEFLEPRGFGDADADALVLLGLVDADQRMMRTSAPVEDVAASVLERGLLGLPSAL